MHRNLGIGSWIARQARIAPDRLALVFGDRRWSYGALDARLTRLARALAARGVDRGDRVAYLGHNHPAALEVMFACGLLGAIAVPIHPGFDASTVRAILGDVGPRAVIVTPALLPLVQHVERRALIADTAQRYEDLIAGASDEPIDRPIGLDHACLLAFTSGTTGRSRGVVLTHGNLLFNAVNLLTRLDYLRDDIILTAAPLYRMGGVGFLLPLVLKGGTCVLQERADPETSLRLIERHRVTIVFDAVHALAAIARAPAFASTDLSSLRICATGGSYVPAALRDAYRRRGLRLQPGYGLTEAAPVALLADRDDGDAPPGTAGRPPLFVAVRIVDAALDDVAPGETGELLVHGPNVMTGYWRDADATAAALVEDGWLRTGDAARAAADGTIAIVGRVAEALVLGGQHVHPEPIEEALRDDVALADCAIVQAAPGTVPAIFVVPPPDRPLEHARLLAGCRARLGVTPTLHVAAALPKNPNGKIVRAQLVAQLRASAPGATSSVQR